MVLCTFCKYSIEPGTGSMLIKNDGKSLNFCSSKCKKNQLKLKRKPRKLQWTKAYQKPEVKK